MLTKPEADTTKESQNNKSNEIKTGRINESFFFIFASM